VRTLPAIRRHHLTDWRKQLKPDNPLAPRSINHRLEIVTAILRTGWREAEMQEVNLERINEFFLILVPRLRRIAGTY
jgi:hypothetical protein